MFYIHNYHNNITNTFYITLDNKYGFMINILLHGWLLDTPLLIDIVYQADNRHTNASTQGRPVDNIEGF